MGRGPACPAHAEDSLPTKESGPPLSARQAPQAVGGRVVGGPRLEEDQPLPPAGGGGFVNIAFSSAGFRRVLGAGQRRSAQRALIRGVAAAAAAAAAAAGPP